MCGICGIFSPGSRDLSANVQGMTDTLKHRGPDGWGIWDDNDAGIALGHRRLSIVDLSAQGSQPMASACGRFVVSYNGEVYNAQQIKSELESLNHNFRGRSDTEVMLAAISQWGIQDAVQRFNGMFAFALWDKMDRELTLVRDRMGIKPLYYGTIESPNGPTFVFGSEIKSLLALPYFKAEINRNALNLYFKYSYIPAPHSIYTGIHKLEPGNILVVKKPCNISTPTSFWSSRDVWAEGAANPLQIDEREAVEALENLLRDATAKRMMADVPLGAFLSGGIDSSTIVALMQAQSTARVKTFTIGFAEEAYNEATHARDVANHLGVDHTELMLSHKDLLDIVPDVPKYWDEPFADASQIPTLCVSHLARKHVTVSLSGDGGDELFSGYHRYHFIAKTWNKVGQIPRPLRRLIAGTGGLIPNSLYRLAGPIGPKIQWRLEALNAKDLTDAYRFLVSHHATPPNLVLDATAPLTSFDDSRRRAELDPYQNMAMTDLETYLPDDILTKVDRASMAVSLEARVPLLDYRIVEFASRVPTAMKIRGMGGKHLLKQVLYKYVPQSMVDRPKMGFGVPVDQWMRTELRDWCESLLDPVLIQQQGLLDHKAVQCMWQQYLAGQTNWFASLWDILMFQAWYEEWIS